MNDVKTQLIESYRACKNVGQAARQMGMNALSAYKILAMSGTLTMDDRCSIGTRSSQLGAKAELEFQRLVPSAKLQNCDEYQRKDFDFILKTGQTVDVKCRSRLEKKNGGYGWSFAIQRHYQTKKAADFYCLFALHGDSVQDGYDIYLLPTAIADDVKVICFSEKTQAKHWIFDYKIAPEELEGFLDFTPNHWAVIMGQELLRPEDCGIATQYISGVAV